MMFIFLYEIQQKIPIHMVPWIICTLIPWKFPIHNYLHWNNFYFICSNAIGLRRDWLAEVHVSVCQRVWLSSLGSLRCLSVSQAACLSLQRLEPILEIGNVAADLLFLQIGRCQTFLIYCPILINLIKKF